MYCMFLLYAIFAQIAIDTCKNQIYHIFFVYFLYTNTALMCYSIDRSTTFYGKIYEQME